MGKKKVAIVTGGARGIGKAIALKLAEVGANVVVNDIGEAKPLESVAAEIRAIRPPDAYKGKGIRYLGETVRLKPGKGKQSGK